MQAPEVLKVCGARSRYRRVLVRFLMLGDGSSWLGEVSLFVAFAFVSLRASQGPDLLPFLLTVQESLVTTMASLSGPMKLGRRPCASCVWTRGWSCSAGSR